MEITATSEVLTSGPSTELVSKMQQIRIRRQSPGLNRGGAGSTPGRPPGPTVPTATRATGPSAHHQMDGLVIAGPTTSPTTFAGEARYWQLVSYGKGTTSCHEPDVR